MINNNLAVCRMEIPPLNLDTHDQCFAQYAVYPGELLSVGAFNPLEVIGMGKLDRKLWVKIDNKRMRLEEIYTAEQLAKIGCLLLVQKEENENGPANKKRKQETNAEFKKPFPVSSKMDQPLDFNVFFLIEGQEIKAHKKLLLKRSPSFNAVLAKIPLRNENKKIVKITNCNLEDFKLLMSYLNKKSVSLKEKNIFKINQLAEYFSIQRLNKKCQEIFTTFLKNKNVSSYLTKLFPVKGTLFTLSEKYFCENFSKILKDCPENIVDFSPSVLIYLLQQDNFLPHRSSLALLWINLSKAEAIDQFFTLLQPFLKEEEILVFYLDIFYQAMENHINYASKDLLEVDIEFSLKSMTLGSTYNDLITTLSLTSKKDLLNEKILELSKNKSVLDLVVEVSKLK